MVLLRQNVGACTVPIVVVTCLFIKTLFLRLVATRNNQSVDFDHFERSVTESAVVDA